MSCIKSPSLGSATTLSSKSVWLVPRLAAGVDK